MVRSRAAARGNGPDQKRIASPDRDSPDIQLGFIRHGSGVLRSNSHASSNVARPRIALASRPERDATTCCRGVSFNARVRPRARRDPTTPCYTRNVPTDTELLDAWRRGDNRAGEVLFDRYFESIRRFFCNKASDSVEDLVQQTFMACLESRDRFRGQSSFRTYLFAIAHNVLYKHFRRKRRKDSKIDFGVTSVHDVADSPTQILAERDEERVLLSALRRIPIDLQTVLELYFWEKLTAAEIGEITGAPEGTVRTRIRRAKQLVEIEIGKFNESPQLLQSTITDLERWASELRQGLTRRPPATPS
ncbi:MAG: sigma-70 family RNA polymerase sigma factor [Myxococcales bacterium FL481]|nr:MAG: sigma-70 family RNA polymerase sigma factor [Myxococcales bacterium FL481]